MSTQQQIDELSDAAETGDLARLQALLDAGVPIDGRHKWGKTALWAAAQRGGDCWCIDLAPAAGGTRGQMI